MVERAARAAGTTTTTRQTKRKAAPAKTKVRRPRVVKAVIKAVKPATARMTEAQFQRQVKAVLATLGFVVWTFPIMKRTVAGVPDLTFWHPNRPGRLYFWELKTSTGRIRPDQAIAIAHLSTVKGVDARIVRPDDWVALREELIR